MHEIRILTAAVPGCGSILVKAHSAFRSDDVDPQVVVELRFNAAALLLKADVMLPGAIGQALRSLESFETKLDASLYLLLESSKSHNRQILELYPWLARAMAAATATIHHQLHERDAEGYGVECLSLLVSVFQAACLVGSKLGGSSSQPILGMWDRVWPSWSRLLDASLNPQCVNGVSKIVPVPSANDFYLAFESCCSIEFCRFGHLLVVYRFIHLTSILGYNISGSESLRSVSCEAERTEDWSRCQDFDGRWRTRF